MIKHVLRHVWHLTTKWGHLGFAWDEIDNAEGSRVRLRIAPKHEQSI